MGESGSTSNLTLSLDAFVRSVGVNRNAPHAFFIGAGASITSGVPSATTCMWQWKRDIFLTKNPGVENQFRDSSLPNVQQKIQQWLDSEGKYPPLHSPEEYSFYVEQCYPIGQDRRKYFQELISGAKPYIGYQLLCLLAEAGLIKSVWTTNFDRLTERAAASSNLTTIEVGLDTTERVVRQPQRGELLCVALHGDYRYDELKNTNNELQTQEQKIRDALIQHLRDSTLIVIGYSGRDHSVMSALADAYSQTGSGRLYWCGYKDPEPPNSVRDLLTIAREHGREAYYVPSYGFDDLLSRLSLHCLTGDLLNHARELYSKVSTKFSTQSRPFEVESSHVTSLIKSNAFPIECPSEVLQFEAPDFKIKGAWKALKKQVEGSRVVAVLLKGKVLAIGTIEDIKETFAGKIIGEIEHSPISEKELSYNDGVIISLLAQALVRSIAESRQLNTDNRCQVWEKNPSSTSQVGGITCQVYEAAILYLRRYDNQQYLVIKPTIKGTTKDGQDLPEETVKELKRKILTKQYNSQFNDAVNKWRTLLFNGSITSFEFPANCGSIFKFNIKTSPVFAQISTSQARNSIIIPPKFLPFIVHSGMQYQEPPLVFSNRQGDGFERDTHPIRGIVNNQPYDFSLSQRGLSREIRLGIVCPTQDASKLSGYLNSLNQKHKPNSKSEYLLEYPGFGQAFGLPLDIPQLHNNAWIECPEPNEILDTKKGATELSHQITTCIKSLKASASPNLILVYIPRRWQKWERYNADDERFDLHDFVKAYCVQRGIATQFLREDTLTDDYQCQVIWWLALALYVKAMRTPWILESLDAETAFMGLGFSHDLSAQKGKHIILGCSHIYSSEGLGLRYSLSKIEEPIFDRQGNPYMSRDDARRLGENARQLFYESKMRLPRRVAIHKRTPFRKDEREGLLEGLAGIDLVDMLEINVDEALKYVASRIYEGKFQGDNFPVRRGTTVVLEGQKALIWVHGTTEAINPRRHYYPGRSRIPAPLSIIRHHGTSSLGTLAREILGLSKMDWNNFEMYTKLPATIQSSNKIASIGALLERFGPLSYDYRLFM